MTIWEQCNAIWDMPIDEVDAENDVADRGLNIL